jgi:hypothetical protein
MDMTLEDELSAAMKVVNDAPPRVYLMIARYDVPGVFRYWDTKGRLIVYVNRTAIECLSKRDYAPGVTVRELEGLGPCMGIPVRFEGPTASEWVVKMIEDHPVDWKPSWT